MRGPNDSAVSEEAISYFAAEAKEKVALNQAHLLYYESFKGDFPTKIKVSPIAVIPQKSKEFRSIMDLSFSFKLSPHGRVPSVNENSGKSYPRGAIDQIGHVLLRLICAFNGSY